MSDPFIIDIDDVGMRRWLLTQAADGLLARTAHDAVLALYHELVAAGVCPADPVTLTPGLLSVVGAIQAMAAALGLLRDAAADEVLRLTEPGDDHA